MVSLTQLLSSLLRFIRCDWRKASRGHSSTIYLFTSLQVKLKNCTVFTLRYSISLIWIYRCSWCCDGLPNKLCIHLCFRIIFVFYSLFNGQLNIQYCVRYINGVHASDKNNWTVYIMFIFFSFLTSLQLLTIMPLFNYECRRLWHISCLHLMMHNTFGFIAP